MPWPSHSLKNLSRCLKSHADKSHADKSHVATSRVAASRQAASHQQEFKHDQFDEGPVAWPRFQAASAHADGCTNGKAGAQPLKDGFRKCARATGIEARAQRSIEARAQRCVAPSEPAPSCAAAIASAPPFTTSTSAAAQSCARFGAGRIQAACGAGRGRKHQSPASRPCAAANA